MHTPALRRRRRTTGSAALVALAALTLTACGSSASGSPADGSDSSSAGDLAVVDPWVKSADSGMTAAFGTLTNDGDADVVVTGVSSEASPTMELHETVSGDGGMQMRQKEGGFTVPAGGEVALTPGGNHLMLMDVAQPLRPGEEVTFTLELADGTTTDFDAVVKEFSGADEEYVGGQDS